MAAQYISKNAYIEPHVSSAQEEAAPPPPHKNKTGKRAPLHGQIGPPFFRMVVVVVCACSPMPLVFLFSCFSGNVQ